MERSINKHKASSLIKALNLTTKSVACLYKSLMNMAVVYLKYFEILY